MKTKNRSLNHSAALWLYYRLSRDEDEELNSLMNQRSMIESYALKAGHTIVGESFGDHISGMHFNRDGIEQLTQAVDAGQIDAVIVKDLSRLGRHQLQTALFIDYLRSSGVSVISVTEVYSNEHDDLAEIYTHNTNLKKRLLAYAKENPELCQLTEGDEQGGLRFEIDKNRIGIRLTAPYPQERRSASSQRAKRTGIPVRNK